MSGQNDDLKPFEAGKWAGHQKWACPACPFDTVEAPTMRKHLKKHQPAKKASGLILPGDPGFAVPAPALRTNNPETNGGTQ